MPAYDYEITDNSGQPLGSITVILPVAERDDVDVCRRGPFLRLLRRADGSELARVKVGTGRVRARRAQLPQRLTVAGHAQNPTASDYQMARGFYAAEQRLGSDFDRHAGGMTKAEIRRVMAMPDAPIEDDNHVQ